MKRILYVLAVIFTTFPVFSTEPDVIVTNDNQILKVYNLDISSKNAYYTLSEDDTDVIHRMPVSNILIIKDAQGNKIDPSALSAGGRTNNASPLQNTVSHAPRPEVTWVATGEISTHKDGYELFEGCGADDTENTLWFRMRPDRDGEIMVTRSPKKMNRHPSEEYIIPDYVTVDGVKLPVTKIDKEAFWSSMYGNPYKTRIRNLSLPETLEEIGENSFSKSFGDTKLILPENVKIIGAKAFHYGGSGKEFTELYIPSGVESIGAQAFLFLGPPGNFSYRGFYKGYLTSIPYFVTPDNCQQYGIDETAVENYERRAGIRKD